VRLEALLALEAAYAQRGFRVSFQRLMDGGDGWQTDELVQDDNVGWPTAEEAECIADRLRAVAGKTIREIRVIGPDGEPVEPVGIEGVLAGVNEAAGVIAEPVASTSRPIRPGEPPEDQPLTVLSGSQLDDYCLVGTAAGDIYCVLTTQLKDWTATTGRRIRWKVRHPQGAVLVGTDLIQFTPVRDATSGLAALVGFHAPTGVWWAQPLAA